jgi:TfoX/Sxy family transcriptional regulator of competence genes
MATGQGTIDHLTDLLSDLAPVRALPMFGEFGLYVGVKLVGLVCNDTLYLKLTPATENNPLDREPPYPKAKPHLLVPDDMMDDRDALTNLVRTTADALPQPKKIPKRLQ